MSKTDIIVHIGARREGDKKGALRDSVTHGRSLHFQFVI
jgi:hypothetical protein